MALWSLFGRESSEGAFCVLGELGETQGPSTSHQVRFANLMLRSG